MAHRGALRSPAGNPCDDSDWHDTQGASCAGLAALFDAGHTLTAWRRSKCEQFSPWTNRTRSRPGSMNMPPSSTMSPFTSTDSPCTASVCRQQPSGITLATSLTRWLRHSNLFAGGIASHSISPTPHGHPVGTRSCGNAAEVGAPLYSGRPPSEHGGYVHVQHVEP